MHRRPSLNERTSRAGNPIQGVKRLLSYLKPYKVKLIMVFVLVILGTILNILGPFLLGRTIDLAMFQKDLSKLLQMVLLILGIQLLKWIFNVISGWIMARTAQDAMRTMRQELFDHLQRLSIGYFDGQTTGDLMSRLTNDMEAINQLLAQNLVSFIQSITQMVGVLVILV